MTTQQPVLNLSEMSLSQIAAASVGIVSSVTSQLAAVVNELNAAYQKVQTSQLKQMLYNGILGASAGIAGGVMEGGSSFIQGATAGKKFANDVDYKSATNKLNTQEEKELGNIAKTSEKDVPESHVGSVEGGSKRRDQENVTKRTYDLKRDDVKTERSKNNNAAEELGDKYGAFTKGTASLFHALSQLSSVYQQSLSNGLKTVTETQGSLNQLIQQALREVGQLQSIAVAITQRG